MTDKPNIYPISLSASFSKNPPTQPIFSSAKKTATEEAAFPSPAAAFFNKRPYSFSADDTSSPCPAARRRPGNRPPPRDHTLAIPESPDTPDPTARSHAAARKAREVLIRLRYQPLPRGS